MRVVALALLAGCQPQVWPEQDLCHDAPPAAGEVYVGPVDCLDMRISGGEGRNADYWMANSVFRAILRHPQDAQTVLRVGGGTVVDAAPWGSDDRLHEVIPIVSGGWLALESFEVERDKIRMGGTVVSLPDQVAEDPGAWREVTWHIAPDSPWLTLEGADGLWLHGSGGGALLDGQWVYDSLVYGHDGEVTEDLGGAIRVAEPTGLLVSPRAEAWTHMGGEQLAGLAPGATDVEVFRDGQRVARLPVDDDGLFSGGVPAGSETCRAIAPGFAPSPASALGTDLTLELGATGSLLLNQSPAEPVAVSWTDSHGRAGWRLLGAEGGPLDLGAGVYDLTLSAGPTWESRDLRVEIPPEATIPLGIQLDSVYDPGNRVLAATTWPSDRSRTWRGSNTTSAQRAAGQGIGYVVFTPEDDISSVDSNALGFPAIPVRDGSLTTGEGWSLATWTWSANSKRSAHGAVDPTGLDAAQGLAAASGGPVVDRLGVVDLSGLSQLDAPHLVDPHPDLVRLDHPGDAGPLDSPWQPWFDWLDAGGLLAPVGPRTWVDVVDRALYGWVDVEAGLIRGETVATTGSLVTLDVGGFGPGHVVSEDDRQPGWEVHIAILGDAPLDQLALIGTGGSIVRSWTGMTEVDAFLLLEDEHWVVAMAWSTQTDDFAVTGPVWVRPPQ
jgi:hypothetical protein